MALRWTGSQPCSQPGENPDERHPNPQDRPPHPLLRATPGLGRLAGREPCLLPRRLAAAGEEERRAEVPVLRRGARGGPLLWVDRRAEEDRGRLDLAAEVHAARGAERLVEDQPGESRGAHQERQNAGGRAGGGREGQARRPVGGGVRRAEERDRAERLPGGTGPPPQGESLLRHLERRQPLRHPVAPPDRQEGRDAGTTDAAIFGNAGEGGEAASLTRKGAALGAAPFPTPEDLDVVTLFREPIAVAAARAGSLALDVGGAGHLVAERGGRDRRLLLLRGDEDGQRRRGRLGQRLEESLVLLRVRAVRRDTPGEQRREDDQGHYPKVLFHHVLLDSEPQTSLMAHPLRSIKHSIWLRRRELRRGPSLDSAADTVPSQAKRKGGGRVNVPLYRVNVSLNLYNDPLNLYNDSLNLYNDPLNLCNDPLNLCNDPLNLYNDSLNLCNDPLNLCNDPLNLYNDPLNLCTDPLNLCNDPLNLCNDPLNLCNDPLNLCNDSLNLCK